MTFLNGVAGRSHSREHAIHSAEIFSQCKPMLVGTGGLTMFLGTPPLEEAQRGEFDPLSEKEMLEELKLFVENLTCECCFITHHTISGVNLSGPDFLARKDKIVAALEDQISKAIWAGWRHSGGTRERCKEVEPCIFQVNQPTPRVGTL